MNEADRLAEASRWLRYAQEDLDTAESVLSSGAPRQAPSVRRQNGRQGMRRYLSEKNLGMTEGDLGFLIDLLKSSFPEIELCIREDSLNLYHRGNSLAKIKFPAKEAGPYRVEISSVFYGRSNVSKDDRFRKLAKNGGKGRTTLDLPPDLLHPFFQSKYIADLCKRIKARNYCEEITTEQILICDNRGRADFIIIDRQVAFPGRRDIRIDLLALRQVERGSNSYRFQILEVKLGNNADLKGEVAKQLDKYISHVTDEFPSYKACYEKQYEQKRHLGLIDGTCFENIEIVKGVQGVVVVTGYLGTAQPSLDKLPVGLKVVSMRLWMPE